MAAKRSTSASGRAPSPSKKRGRSTKKAKGTTKTASKSKEAAKERKRAPSGMSPGMAALLGMDPAEEAQREAGEGAQGLRGMMEDDGGLGQLLGKALLSARQSHPSETLLAMCMARISPSPTMRWNMGSLPDFTTKYATCLPSGDNLGRHIGIELVAMLQLFCMSWRSTFFRLK